MKKFDEKVGGNSINIGNVTMFKDASSKDFAIPVKCRVGSGTRVQKKPSKEIKAVFLGAWVKI